MKASRELHDCEILEDWGSLGAPERHENGYSHLGEMGVSIFETCLSSRKPQEGLKRAPRRRDLGGLGLSWLGPSDWREIGK